MEAARTPLECTEETNDRRTPLECREMERETPLECTGMAGTETREKRRCPCISLAFLRAGVVSGNRIRLIIMSAYSMRLGSCGG
jgi:hypothetical protein